MRYVQETLTVCSIHFALQHFQLNLFWATLAQYAEPRPDAVILTGQFYILKIWPVSAPFTVPRASSTTPGTVLHSLSNWKSESMLTTAKASDRSVLHWVQGFMQTIWQET